MMDIYMFGKESEGRWLATDQITRTTVGSIFIAASALDDTAGSFPQNLTLFRDEIAGTVAGIDQKQLATLTAHIELADRIFVARAGHSDLVLRMTANRLMHLGYAVHVADDTTTPAITSGDLLLVAFGSGTTSGVAQLQNQRPRRVRGSLRSRPRKDQCWRPACSTPVKKPRSGSP
jgi:DNA-binding MurR/RpiR family transcriptional regulator